MKKVIAFSGAGILLLCIGLGCFFLFERFNTHNGNKNTNPIYAEIALKNLAVGMRTYSTTKGGSGNTIFTDDISQIKEYVMRDAYQALQRENQIPYNGYIFELVEYPVGDNFQNNFKFIARPAKGFVGQSFQVDKHEQVSTIK